MLRVDFGNGKDERARKRQTALADDDFGIRHGDRELNGFSALLGDEQRSRPVGRQMARCLGAGEQVELNIGGTLYPMSRGDSVRIPANAPHTWHNPTDTEVRVIFAITPPTF